MSIFKTARPASVVDEQMPPPDRSRNSSEEIPMKNAIRRVARSRAILTSVLIFTISGLLVAGTADTALAGSNGQQAIACSNDWSVQHVVFSGTNYAGFQSTLYLDGPGTACYYTTGWWWKGRLFYDFYDENWQYVYGGNCTVPENQDGNDWYFCGG